MSDFPYRTPVVAQQLQVAIKINDSGSAFFTMLRPARHHDLIRSLAEGGWTGKVNGDMQGFCYQGRFATREEAARIVGKLGKLFSEDLW